MKTATGTNRRRQWVLDCGARYWPKGRNRIEALPIPVHEALPGTQPVLRQITLPGWAADLGVDGKLLAFSCSIEPKGNLPEWRRCDWIANTFHMLAGSVESEIEQSNGPVLSYAFRLPRALDPLHERAWVNRIFLFLRRWAAREADMREETLFGPRPRPRIRLTHDVDALRLTPEIRAKQVAFQVANAMRCLAAGELSRALVRFGDARRYGFSTGDFLTFDRLRDAERAASLTSVLHFYGGPPGMARATPRRILIDPGYDVTSDTMRSELRAFAEGGWTLGLHQSFDAWADTETMALERTRVEEAAGGPIHHCRQHWLHFSWARTWAAQAGAGLKLDSTLGFNDRPGFRTGHALTIRPWSHKEEAALSIETVPMVFMDSHFYDYSGPEQSDPEVLMKHWIDEVQSVGGDVTVNWHTHTITEVYGWGKGYESLLGLLS